MPSLPQITRRGKSASEYNRSTMAEKRSGYGGAESCSLFGTAVIPESREAKLATLPKSLKISRFMRNRWVGLNGHSISSGRSFH